MELNEYRSQVLNDANVRASTDGLFTAHAFLSVMGDEMAMIGEIENLQPASFRAKSGTRNMRLDGYDLGDSDDSIALAAVHFSGKEGLPTLAASNARKHFNELRAFVTDSLKGTSLSELEESSPEYQVARDVHDRARSTTRFRLYLFTDCAVSGKADEFSVPEVEGVPVQCHVFDIRRLHQLHESDLDHEPLDIDLTHWLPAGLPALCVEAKNETVTYLAAVPGNMLADLYGAHGSRLLESNVRSFLSARGKVNRGIRDTLIGYPGSFLAYNNGITATALTTVADFNGSSALLRSLRGLQIVNGGQTTASMYFVRRDHKADLSDAWVQVKLVVVDPDKAKEMVPLISRYANSQNPVNEADFFSNHPFHVRMESIARRVPAPSEAGRAFHTYWVYERTRGSFQNELSKRSNAEQKRYLQSHPRSQVITKTDAAKFEVSWDGAPHLVSQGAQKNFVRYATMISKLWGNEGINFNELYFKHLVAKSILFNQVRRAVSKMDWYGGGYLANIVTYTIAKLRLAVTEQFHAELNLDEIWDAQSVPPAVLEAALGIAYLMSRVLESDERPVVNVTEWAKKADCWSLASRVPTPLDAGLGNHIVSTRQLRERRRASQDIQREDNKINLIVTAMEISREEWGEVEAFATKQNVLTSTAQGVLRMIRQGRVPSERQAGVALKLLEQVERLGYQRLE